MRFVSRPLRLMLPLSVSLLLGGCVVASAVDLVGTTVLTAGKLAVKGTGALVGAMIPDGKDKAAEENKPAKREADAAPKRQETGEAD